MKKRNINKVITLTLGLIIALSTVVSAKTLKTNTYKATVSHDYIDPFPKGDE